ncbi:MAG: alpha/beta hydrolase, partial [Nitratireductor sp.]|nr:alpha/beta hydrolase [Nitratireductor sp.]
MELVQPVDNPMPPNPVSGHVETVDGVKLRFARWKTHRAPSSGTVLLLQGRAEYIEKQYETITDLRNSGHDVLAFDWRGQGGSSRLLKDRKRGYVASFDQYVTDLDTILEKVALPDCRGPYFILAHSTGSLVALLAAPRLANRIQRMVLASPFVGFGAMPIPPRFLTSVAGFLSLIGLGSIYMAGGPTPDEKRTFTGNRLTSDTRRFTRNAGFAAQFPDLSIGGPTAGWLLAAANAMERLRDPDYVGAINIPSLLVIAGADEVVSNRAIEELGRRLRSGHSITIDGAKHELLQERD